MFKKSKTRQPYLKTNYELNRVDQDRFLQII